MDKKKQWVFNTTAALFGIGLISLLIFYFDISLITLGILVFKGAAIGLIFGTAIALTFSVVNPPEWIYNYRYILEGIGWGAMIGSIGLVTNSTTQPLTLDDVILSLIVGGSLGVLWIHFTRYKKFKQQKEGMPQKSLDTADLCDIASIIERGSSNQSGLLVLNNNRIQFFSADKQKKINDLALENINPKIIRKTWFNLHSGIQLTNNIKIQNLMFPQYWLEEINNQKNL